MERLSSVVKVEVYPESWDDKLGFLQKGCQAKRYILRCSRVQVVCLVKDFQIPFAADVIQQSYQLDSGWQYTF